MLRQGINQLFLFGVYDHLKMAVYGLERDATISSYQALILVRLVRLAFQNNGSQGIIAGGLGPLFNNPVDVAKTRLMAQMSTAGEQPKYTGTLQCIATVAKEEVTPFNPSLLILLGSFSSHERLHDACLSCSTWNGHHVCSCRKVFRVFYQRVIPVERIPGVGRVVIENKNFKIKYFTITIFTYSEKLLLASSIVLGWMLSNTKASTNSLKSMLPSLFLSKRSYNTLTFSLSNEAVLACGTKSGLVSIGSVLSKYLETEEMNSSVVAPEGPLKSLVPLPETINLCMILRSFSVNS